MLVHKDISRLPPISNPVVTIGTFDGVHKGHKNLIERINYITQSIEGESVILTFHPHPRSVLGAGNLKLITALEEKTRLLSRTGIGHLVVAAFTEKFSGMSPVAYVSNFLVKYLHPKCLVVGYDHHFGKGRKGDIGLLKKISPEYGFSVEEISRLDMDDIAVSSSRIRLAVASGDIRTANRLLGYEFLMLCRVVEGNKMGRSIGFPTANLCVEDPDKLIPADGVYAVRAVFEGITYSGMLFTGMNPDFNGSGRTIEANLFDFNENIYGKEIGIHFVEKIREPARFGSPEALRLQLADDREKAIIILQETMTDNSTL